MTTSDDGTTWTGTFTPTTDIEDTTNIFTLATTFTDVAGNPISTQTVTNNYVVDTLKPTITSDIINYRR